jgi:acyltransferase
MTAPLSRSAGPLPVPRPSGPATAVRSGGLDAVRVVAILAVVLGHVWTNDVVDRLVYPWHVAVFFFLTGYLWSPGRSIRTEVVRRWRSVAIPYLTWLAILWVGLLITRCLEREVRLAELLKPLYGGAFATRPFSAYWFLSVLFFVAVLARCVERLPVRVRVGVVVLGLAAGYAAGSLLAKTPLAIGSALPCLSILVLGRLLALVRARIRHGVPLGLIAGGLGAALVWSGAVTPLNVKHGEFGTPVGSLLVAALYCVALVLVCEALFRSLPSIWSSAVTLLASAGLTVVLTHAVILDVLDVGEEGSIPAFVAAAVIPWSLGIIFLYTPVSEALNGTPRRHLRRELESPSTNAETAIPQRESSAVTTSSKEPVGPTSA